MEEEEAVLRKQLEEAEDFDERREIRQKLRELRKKKLAALETDSPATTDRDKRRAERKRQREKENEENRDTTEIKSETKTAKDAVSNEGTENDNAVVSTFQLSVSTTQALTVENGTTNGSAEEEVPVEADDEKETIGENHSKNGVDSNEETSEQDVQEASVENGSTEDEPVEVKKEQLSDSKNNKEVMENGKEMASKQNEKTDESSLTVIEEIEDVDNLERLLKDIPLSEFELRKKIRSQIRMIKVKQAQAKAALPPSKFKTSTVAKTETSRPNTSTTKNTKVEKDQGKHNVTSHRRDNVDGKKVQVNKTVEVSDKCEGKMTTVENKKVKPVEMSDKYGCKMEGAAMIKKNTKTSVEVSEKDGGKKVVTTKVEKNMEVHKSDGTTITVTKTTKTAEVQRKGPPVRGGIDARLAQMRKERVMAKKQAVTDTKNKRAAFMQKLESQSSSKGEVKRSFSSKSNVSLLLQWCKRRTQYHEGVDITNFTTSWANGLAFCALLHYFVPDSIPYESLQPSDKKGNWALGFRVAGEEGIEPLLELEDVMCVDVPEPKSLITYIHFVYQHFMEKQQKEKTLAQ